MREVVIFVMYHIVIIGKTYDLTERERCYTLLAV